MSYFKNFIKQGNFLYLFSAFFFSELGGFLTNTCVLLHINKVTNGDLFYLGLSQTLFVLPLALGTLLGGALGESFNKKKVMVFCEILNFFLVLGLVFTHQKIIAIILLRGFIVLLAGIYNPSRQAIVQEILEAKYLRGANASFTSTFAFFHAIVPVISVFLYKNFNGIQEIFVINVFTYLIGALLLIRIHYTYENEMKTRLSFSKIYNDIWDGFIFVKGRSDLFAILANFTLVGILMGVFYPTVLPYIKDVYNTSNSDNIFAFMSFALASGAILGSLLTTLIMRFLNKGQILTLFAFFQAIVFFMWTQNSNLMLSYILLFMWGMGGMISITTYINYIQLNVQKMYRTRTFSILDQSVAFSSFIGALVVMLIGNNLSASDTLSLIASIGILIMLVRVFDKGLRELYKMTI